MPKVAVLLSTYNGFKYIPDFFKSLELQTKKDFDLIIRDDGSSDDTMSLVTGYRGLMNIIIIDSKGNIGPAKSFIKLLEAANGDYDYFMFADQDDWWNSDKIERACLSIQGSEYSGPLLYCSRLELVDVDLNFIKLSRVPNFISEYNSIVENVVTGCTICMNKLSRDIIMTRAPASLSMHDWWSYIVVSFFGKIIYDCYPSIKYRQHESNAIGGESNIFFDYFRRIKRFFSHDKNNVFHISDQAIEFYRCYGDMLNSEKKLLIENFIYSKSSFFKRISLALTTKFIRQSKVDQFILRLLFILGRY